MIKSVITGAVAVAVVSFDINAAPIIPQGQGEVIFGGAVVDILCGIETQSARQEIDFGQTPESSLQKGGESQPKDLNIKLINYDITNSKKAPVGDGATKVGTVALTFSGVSGGNNKDMLQTVGTTNTAIVAADPRGGRVKFGGVTATGSSNLVDGDSTIHFIAAARRDDSGNLVTKGAFSVAASSNLTYQ